MLTRFVNPLCPNSDKHLFSPYKTATLTNLQDMRMKQMITKDTWCWN